MIFPRQLGAISQCMCCHLPPYSWSQGREYQAIPMIASVGHVQWDGSHATRYLFKLTLFVFHDSKVVHEAIRYQQPFKIVVNA
jgi:hypothetical protein